MLVEELSIDNGTNQEVSRTSFQEEVLNIRVVKEDILIELEDLHRNDLAQEATGLGVVNNCVEDAWVVTDIVVEVVVNTSLFRKSVHIL